MATANVSITVDSTISALRLAMNSAFSQTLGTTAGDSETKTVDADTTAAGVAVAFSTLTSAGWVLATNTDTGVTADYGATSGGSFIKAGEIPPLTSVLLYAGGTTFYI